MQNEEKKKPLMREWAYSEGEEETKARHFGGEDRDKKEEDSVLHQVETSSDRSGADTEDNIHHKEQWSGPWH